MMNFSELMDRARADIECATNVWADILLEFFGPRLEYAYTKGSAMKPWDSPIDYVPIISDVDIHVGTENNELLFGNTKADFDAAIRLSRKCEEEFLRRRPNHLHVPRMQIIETRFLIQSDKYTPPRPQDIHILFGEPSLLQAPSQDVIRAGDLENVLELEDYIDDMPRMAFDRTGLDFWSIIRTMCWRVSPSPVRILTQNSPDPIDVWSWNRTTIHRALSDNGYHRIAEHYHGFYEEGWNLFLSEFMSLSAFRETANHGYYVLRECLKEAKRICAMS